MAASGPHIIIICMCTSAPLIDGLGHATRSTTCLSGASCVIMSGVRTALDLDTYPLSNLIRPQCAEQAKPDSGKPVLIMHIGFFVCFHAISLKCSRFSKIATLFCHALVALKLFVLFISRLVVCSARIVVNKQTDGHTDQVL